MRTELLGADAVAVVGELDLWTAPTFLAEIAAADVVRVDLGAVTFIDVAGLRALAAVDGLQVVRSSPAVDRLLELCASVGWTPLG